MPMHAHRRSSTTRGAGVGVASIIWLIAVVATVILVLYIFMVLFEANPENELVQFVSDFAGNLAWVFRDLFEFDNRKTEVFVNYGLAAVVYVALGNALARILD